MRRLLCVFFLVIATIASAEPPSARQVIRDAQVRAGKANKNVLVYFHASWCSWCRRFDRLFASQEFRESFQESYVIAEITVRERDDLVKNENAGWATVLKELRGTAEQDVPYLVVLSSDGDKLADTFRPEGMEIPGNAGWPRTQTEIEAFLSMLRKTGRKFSAQKRWDLKQLFRAEAETQ
jgi:thioredoxin-related protein